MTKLASVEMTSRQVGAAARSCITDKRMEQREEFDVIQRFEDRTEGELACGLLVSAGLDARLEEHELLHGVSESLPIEGSVGLMVPPDQVEDARALLESARNSGGTQAADIVPEDS